MDRMDCPAATSTAASLRPVVFAALFAALTAVGAYVAVPVGPVPIVLQNFFVMLAGLLLGSRWGVASVGIYLLAGAVGLPVFAGGTGGLARFAGPTGGFLLGYLPVVFLVGRIVEGRPPRLWRDLTALVLGSLLLYLCGVSWLKVVTGMSVSKAIAAGMLPFLPGDGLKVAAAALAARSIRPLLQRQEISPAC
ncbi:MAG: biotin transporter BioY [Desulfobacterales bacterium]